MTMTLRQIMNYFLKNVALPIFIILLFFLLEPNVVKRTEIIFAVALILGLMSIRSWVFLIGGDPFVQAFVFIAFIAICLLIGTIIISLYIFIIVFHAFITAYRLLRYYLEKKRMASNAVDMP